MEYTELRASLEQHSQNSEILVALLAEAGFDSFSTEDDGFIAWIPSQHFNMEEVSELLTNLEWVTGFSFESIADQNWNKEWEKNFDPVEIDGRCRVRAPFHPSKPEFEFEIIIEPKMSFGTAHHETTHQMISLLMDENVEDSTVLDMGSGTGILAILAAKKGAANIWAIDNDEWAYTNCLENVEINDCSQIIVKMGDASLLEQCPDFDLVIANINRNILLADIKHYTAKMKTGAVIFFSGFYESDLETITEEANRNGLKIDQYISMNEWVAARFIK
ncbi:MAG: 50S ribosomal protein L11 methyltransferase [Bacteroidales bacterium]|nr:50S ribosomal protein L11 methyltransferase [Bacteroidales bacterium]